MYLSRLKIDGYRNFSQSFELNLQKGLSVLVGENGTGKSAVIDAIRLFYDALGGSAAYANHSPEVKAICRGLRHDLLRERFPSAAKLRQHLETFGWGPA